MTMSRRALIARGLAVGTGVAGLGAALPDAADAARPAIADLPGPRLFAELTGLQSRGVMQDLSYLPGSGTFFVSQNVLGSNGSRLPAETTIINRVDGDGRAIDSMTLVDGGHGLGIEAESTADGPFVWFTWQGPYPNVSGRGNDVIRARYTPGTWTRARANGQLEMSVVPFRDDPEAVFHVDWATGWAVERHYDWNGATETYTRRRIADVRRGVKAGGSASVAIPVDPPTTQGFTTVDDVLYRWLGKSTTDGQPVPGDGVRLQRWSWNTGRLLAEDPFPSLGKSADGWPDGRFEPEGMCVFRQGGDATLLVGGTSGLPGPDRRYRVWAFPKVA